MVLGGTQPPCCYWAAPAFDSIRTTHGTTQQTCPPAAARWRCTSVLECLLRIASRLKGKVRRQQPADDQWRSAPREAGSGSNSAWDVQRGKFVPLRCFAQAQSVCLSGRGACGGASPSCLSGFKAAKCSASSGLMAHFHSSRKKRKQNRRSCWQKRRDAFRAANGRKLLMSPQSLHPPASRRCVYVGKWSGR